jgi:hypothetical protein
MNPFGLTDYSSAAMNVKAYYLDIGTAANDRFEVDVWDGSSWTNELSWDEDHDPEDINLDLSTYTGLPTVQVRFRYFGDGWDWYAQVDDIALTCAAPVINVDPTALTPVQQPGMLTTLPLTITNNGDAELNWEILEGDCGSPTELPWLSVSPNSGTITPAGDASLEVNFDSTGLTPDIYIGNLCVSSNDPMVPNVALPVEMTVDPLTIGITKTVTPTSLFEPGDDLEITIRVTNTSSINLTVQSLIDSDFDLDTYCPDAVGSILVPGESNTCAFNAFFASNAVEQHLSSVTIIATDGSINTASDSANAQLEILDVDPVISVSRGASPRYALPGDLVTFNIMITNNSVDTDPVTISSLTDDLYGDVTSAHDEITATDCTAGVVIQPGNSYTCSFSTLVPDLPDETLTTTLMVMGSDDEGSQTSASEKTTLILDFLSIYLPIVFK